MNDDQLYDLYLSIFSKLHAGIELTELHFQTPSPGGQFVDRTGREAMAVALAVATGKHERGPLYSKPEFLSQINRLATGTKS